MYERYPLVRAVTPGRVLRRVPQTGGVHVPAHFAADNPAVHELPSRPQGRWYASKAEHGRVVPTWNYLTAHVHGELRVHDDVERLDALVRRLTDRHEAGEPASWSVDDAPAAFVAGHLRAVVGVELVISRVEAKVKMSQNRPPADVAGVVAGLGARGDTTAAAAMRAANPATSVP